MFIRHWNRALVLGGTFALLAIGTAPAAAMDVCPSPTPSRFTGGTVYLAQEPGSDIWSNEMTLTAYCGDVAPGNELTGVAVTAVYATSTGAIPELKASVDGSPPGTLLPVPKSQSDFTSAKLDTQDPGTGNYPVTDARGNVTLRLRAQSAEQPFLAGIDGAPVLIGLQLDWGAGTGGWVDPTGVMRDYPTPVFGGGGIYAATPELDSLVLFGSGATGLAGYALLRLRARRRRD